tara:strand:- start:293 stop:1090 length:798 start_codon:yes stop_codon:yes gene_type:complete
MKAGKLNIQGGKNINVAKRKVASARGFMFNQHNVNISREGLKNLQQRLCITETTADIAGTVTSIGINTTGYDIIKNLDKLIIVNPVTGVGSDVNVTADVKGSDNLISVASVVLYAPAGSFVMFQEEFLNYFVRGGTITYKTTIANAAYKTLNSVPVTLVSGVTGLVMIPVNLLIITDGYISDDEGNDKYLYCGHGIGILSGTFWDSIRSFNYRERANTTWNMTGDTGKIFASSVAGEPIKLYSSGAFESDDFSLKVYLTYRIDSA